MVVFEGRKGCIFRIGVCGRARRAKAPFSRVGISWFVFMIRAGFWPRAWR